MRGSGKQVRRRQVRFTLHESMGDVYRWFERLPPGAATNKEIEFLLRLGIMAASAMSQRDRLQQASGQQVATPPGLDRRAAAEQGTAGRENHGWNLDVAAVAEA